MNTTTAERTDSPPRAAHAGALVPAPQPATPPAPPARPPLPCGNLAAALAWAVRAARGVGKAAYNTFHKYHYASAEAIVEEAKEALSAHGLALVPLELSVDGWEREGADRFELSRKFLLIHSSGESLPIGVKWPICPERGRPLDKATATADTLSLSYLLRDLLLLPRVEEEPDARDTTEYRPAAPAKAPPAPANGASKPAPPRDGAELLARLTAREAQMVRDGLCKAGELLADVRIRAENVGWKTDVPDWAPDRFALVTEWVKEFIGGTKAAPASGPENGMALLKWLTGLDATLAGDGLAPAGSLLRHVATLGQAAGRKGPIEAWTGAFTDAVGWAGAFEAEARARKGPPPADPAELASDADRRALLAMLARKDMTWGEVRKECDGLPREVTGLLAVDVADLMAELAKRPDAGAGAPPKGRAGKAGAA